ncbi:MAG: hypothetical protein N3I35_03460 [Clostridia bacterium]|nr:hypothetical protein [Clostridia bacterium]
MVELIITVTLIAMIITASVSLYIFGTKTFDEGENKAKIQRNVRNTADYLTENIRNCTQFGVTLNTLPPPDAVTYQRGFEVNGNKFTAFNTSSASIQFDVDMISDITFYVYNLSGSAITHLTVKGSSGNQTYEMNREVLLNNLRTAYFDNKITSGDPTGIALGQSNTYSLKDYCLYYGNK